MGMGSWTRAEGALGLLLVGICLVSLGGCVRVTSRSEAPPPAAPIGWKPLTWRVASAHLEDAFAAIPNSSIEDFRREIPAEERARVTAAQGRAEGEEDLAWVYGEPAPASTDLILQRLALGEGDVLFDLGCGRAFFLLQALLTTPLPRAVGVELAATRLEAGRQARAILAREGVLPRGKGLELREEDLGTTDVRDATVVFMDSVFYSEALLAATARHMARAPRLRAVVMIDKGLPPNPWFEVEGTERWKMSWSPRFGTNVLFYRRTAAPAPAS
jgi:hypothetical protein